MSASSLSSSSSSSDEDNDTALAIMQTSVITDDLFSSDDSSDSNSIGQWGGSRPGRSINVVHDFAGAEAMLIRHYFSGAESLYDEEVFEMRFGSPRCVIHRVFESLDGSNPFVLKWDISNRDWGIRPLVRKVGAMRMLIYGDTFDRLDEHLQISKSAMRESMLAFCDYVVDNFKDIYLNRCPTGEEKKRSTDVMKARGFPGCFASWDCKHYFWRNCPVELSEQYKGKEKGNYMVMEAICDPFLYIW